MDPTVSQGDTHIFKYMKVLGRGGTWYCKGISSGYLTWEVGAAVPMDVLTSWDLKGGLDFYWRRKRRGDKVKSHVKLTGQTDSPKEPSGSYWGPSVATAQRLRGNSGKPVLEKRWRGWWSPRPPSPIIAVVLILRSSLSLPSTHPFARMVLSEVGVGIWAVHRALSPATYFGRCCHFTGCVLCLIHRSLWLERYLLPSFMCFWQEVERTAVSQVRWNLSTCVSILIFYLHIVVVGESIPRVAEGLQHGAASYTHK